MIERLRRLIVFGRQLQRADTRLPRVVSSHTPSECAGLAPTHPAPSAEKAPTARARDRKHQAVPRITPSTPAPTHAPTSAFLANLSRRRMVEHDGADGLSR